MAWRGTHNDNRGFGILSPMPFHRRVPRRLHSPRNRRENQLETLTRPRGCVILLPRCYLITRVLPYHPGVILSPGCYIVTEVIFYGGVCCRALLGGIS